MPDKTAKTILWMIDHGSTLEDIRDYVEYLTNAPRTSRPVEKPEGEKSAKKERHNSEG